MVFALALLSVHTVVPVVVCALMTFAVYNANKLSDLDEDTLNRPNETRFVVRHARAIAVLSGLAALLAVGLSAATGGAVGAAVALLPVVAGVVYSLPIVPVGEYTRIKDIYVANTALVALAWGVLIALFPAMLVPDVGTGAVVAVCVYFFLRTFISVEVFNVRDVVGDRASGVETLPVRLGVSDTQTVLLALDLASLVFITAVGPLVGLSETAVLAAVPVTVLSMGLTVAITRCREWNLVCLAKDGEYLVLGLAGLVALF